MEGKALGKGLSALIPEKQKQEGLENITYLKIDEVNDNPYQPRKNYDIEKLSDLIASIKEQGVLQPILVRKKEGAYEVVAGERRLRAARELKMNEVPVVIKSVSDQEALVLALVENIQREDLNAIEEAQAYKRLIEDFNFTQDSVAQSVGKNRSTVTNILRLLKLPEEIQKGILDNIISTGHARSLLSIESPKKQKKLFETTIKKGLSVRDLEKFVRKELLGVGKGKKTIHFKDPYITAAEEDLQRVLGTKVHIDAKKKKGKIIIEYYSPTDLERITEVIKK